MAGEEVAQRGEARADAEPSPAPVAREDRPIAWNRVYAEAVAALHERLGDNAEEAVQAAMRIFFDGKAPEGNPGEALSARIARVAWQAWRSAQRADQRRRAPHIVHQVRPLFEKVTPDAYDALERKRRFERLETALADDPEAAGVLRLVRQGVTDGPEQAEALGMTYEEVRNARKRIQRHVEAIAREDRELKEKQAMKPRQS